MQCLLGDNRNMKLLLKISIVIKIIKWSTTCATTFSFYYPFTEKTLGRWKWLQIIWCETNICALWTKLFLFGNSYIPSQSFKPFIYGTCLHIDSHCLYFTLCQTNKNVSEVIRNLFNMIKLSNQLGLNQCKHISISRYMLA